MKRHEMTEGMKVRLIGQRGHIRWNSDGEMDHLKGEIVTVRAFEKRVDGSIIFRIKEDPRWIFDPDDCDPLTDYPSIEDSDLNSILFI